MELEKTIYLNNKNSEDIRNENHYLKARVQKYLNTLSEKDLKLNELNNKYTHLDLELQQQRKQTRSEVLDKYLESMKSNKS